MQNSFLIEQIQHIFLLHLRQCCSIIITRGRYRRFCRLWRTGQRGRRLRRGRGGYVACTACVTNCSSGPIPGAVAKLRCGETLCGGRCHNGNQGTKKNAMLLVHGVVPPIKISAFEQNRNKNVTQTHAEKQAIRQCASMETATTRYAESAQGPNGLK